MAYTVRCRGVDITDRVLQETIKVEVDLGERSTAKMTAYWPAGEGLPPRPAGDGGALTGRQTWPTPEATATTIIRPVQAAVAITGMTRPRSWDTLDVLYDGSLVFSGVIWQPADRSWVSSRPDHDVVIDGVGWEILLSKSRLLRPLVTSTGHTLLTTLNNALMTAEVEGFSVAGVDAMLGAEELDRIVYDTGFSVMDVIRDLAERVGAMVNIMPPKVIEIRDRMKPVSSGITFSATNVRKIRRRENIRGYANQVVIVGGSAGDEEDQGEAEQTIAVTFGQKVLDLHVQPSDLRKVVVNGTTEFDKEEEREGGELWKLNSAAWCLERTDGAVSVPAGSVTVTHGIALPRRRWVFRDSAAVSDAGGAAVTEEIDDESIQTFADAQARALNYLRKACVLRVRYEIETLQGAIPGAIVPGQSAMVDVADQFGEVDDRCLVITKVGAKVLETAPTDAIEHVVQKVELQPGYTLGDGGADYWRGDSLAPSSFTSRVEAAMEVPDPTSPCAPVKRLSREGDIGPTDPDEMPPTGLSCDNAARSLVRSALETRQSGTFNRVRAIPDTAKCFVTLPTDSGGRWIPVLNEMIGPGGKESLSWDTIEANSKAVGFFGQSGIAPSHGFVHSSTARVTFEFERTREGSDPDGTGPITDTREFDVLPVLAWRVFFGGGRFRTGQDADGNSLFTSLAAGAGGGNLNANSSTPLYTPHDGDLLYGDLNDNTRVRDYGTPPMLLTAGVTVPWRTVSGFNPIVSPTLSRPHFQFGLQAQLFSDILEEHASRTTWRQGPMLPNFAVGTVRSDTFLAPGPTNPVGSDGRYRSIARFPGENGPTLRFQTWLYMPSDDDLLAVARRRLRVNGIDRDTLSVSQTGAMHIIEPGFYYTGV